MLPTTGFFKNIDCPYYETSCDRPYCHFKHRKKTNESGEISKAPAAPEVPTYNPTPKSQLASARSHIPISYVPDLAIRSERNNFRSLSSYGYEGSKQPTYNPTPLSILSTGKATNNSQSPEDKKPKEVRYNAGTISHDVHLNNATTEYVPTAVNEDSNDYDFEGLETEFDLIDELMSDSGACDTVNGESESTEDEKCQRNSSSKPTKSKSSSEALKSNNLKVQSHSKSGSNKYNKVENKKNEKVSESSKSKSDSTKSKSGSHTSKKTISSKSDSKHKKDDKHSSKSSKEVERKAEDKHKSSRSSTKTKQHDSKDRHSSKSKHKENSAEKDRSKHSTKSKERDKERRSRKHKEKARDNGVTKQEGRAAPTKNKTNDQAGLMAEMGGANAKSKLSSNYKDDCDTSIDLDDAYHDYVGEDDESDLDDDPLEECYKIFTEYKPTEPQIFPDVMRAPQPVVLTATADDEVAPNLHHSKKRIAHDNADRTKSKVLFTKPKTAPSAAQIMVSRLKAVRESRANNEESNMITEITRQLQLKRPSETSTNDNRKLPKLSKSVVSKPLEAPTTKPLPSSTLIDDIISGKPTMGAPAKPRRIAPVQNVNSIQRAKAKIDEMAKIRAINALTKTSSHSITKGATRTAHVPEYSVADVPEVLEAERSKLPVNVRTRYLTMIVDECMKLYLNKEEAQQRALNEEYKCYERCAALVTYRNSSMLAINRLRKELQEREMSGLGPIFPGEALSTGKDDKCDLRGRQFYQNIKKFILGEDELVLHGFPREGATPGHAAIKFQKKASKGYLEEDDRVCCRCSKLYKVDDEGFPLYAEECIYHPLKKRTFRGESIYLCCRTGEGTGCVTSTTHVSENINVSDAEVEGYQTTMPPEYDDDPRSYEVFALDCEMCYTTKGLELTRVTIVNAELKTVYESLVKPLNSIIDYNTRFSGITEEQMNRTATSILQVQANILHLCNSNTILIGHSLESDMKALKIIHSSIVDTSVLFPHKFGLPHKRALRDLAREYLKKIIQNDVSGHDSAEDALTCMELVQWKVKEDFKARGIKV